MVPLKNLLAKVGRRLVAMEPEVYDVPLYRKLYSDDSTMNRRFYNIGAGSFYHPCWTNVDGASDWYKNVYRNSSRGIEHDLFDLKPMPVNPDSAELAYCSHTIEHVNDAAVQFLFRDVHRMLRRGGIFRVITPNIALIFEAWKRGDREFFYWIDRPNVNFDFEKQCINMPLAKASLTQIFIEDFAAAVSTIALEGTEQRVTDEQFEDMAARLPMEEVLEYCTSRCPVDLQRKFPFRHMNWFTEQKLIQMLRDAGFGVVYRSAYLQSAAAVMRNKKHFDGTMPETSLYVEAVK